MKSKSNEFKIRSNNNLMNNSSITIELSNKRLLTFEETCIYYNLSEIFLLSLIESSQIPHLFCFEEVLLFNREELDNWFVSSGLPGVDRPIIPFKQNINYE